MQTKQGNLSFLGKYCQMFYIQQQKLSEVFLAQNSATDHKLKHIYTHTKKYYKKKNYRVSICTKYSLKKSNAMKECFPESVLSFKKFFNKIFIFGIIFNSQNGYKDSTKDFYIPFTQFPLFFNWGIIDVTHFIISDIQRNDLIFVYWEMTITIGLVTICNHIKLQFFSYDENS